MFNPVGKNVYISADFNFWFCEFANQQISQFQTLSGFGSD